MAAPTLGRPSSYTEEIAQQVCGMIAQGASVSTACAELGIHPSSVYKWLGERADFSERYTRASRDRAIARFERLDETLAELRSGDIDANTARVIVDTIKWQCGKELPRRYGDKLELSGDAASPLTLAVEYVQRGQVDRAPDGIIDARPRPAIDAPKSEE